MNYPLPSSFGLPRNFSSWRENQFEAILNSQASTRPVIGQAMPTGTGKSLAIVTDAMLSGGRGLILTADKNLQDQYADYFSECTLDIKGQKNYPCSALAPGGEYYAAYLSPGATVEEGPCHYGESCSLLLGGCKYYDLIRAAKIVPLTVTNYDLILSVNRYTEGLGHFDFIACDEAHEVPEKLSSAMSAQVTDWEARNLLKCSLFPSEDPLYWANWAARYRNQVTRTIESYKQSGPEFRAKLKTLNNIKRTLDQMSQADRGWIVEVTKDKVRVEPIWPHQFVQPYLLAGAKKVVFASATIRPKTLNLLGLTDFDFFEYPSPFPVASRPVYYVPVVRMRYGMPHEDELRWVRAVDQIIARRLDRKIVVHTVSYSRQKFLLAHSQFAHLMLANTKDDTASIIKAFKTAVESCILVSPSADTGVDFPGTECETVIIIKVPFPDTSSKIYKARSGADPEYGPYIAAQTIVQMAGRGMRSETDRCETIIIDSTFGYLRGEYSHLFPNWFLTAVRKLDTLPSPLQKL